MIIDCISDLHGEFPTTYPGADLLIVAGDLTAQHTIPEYARFFSWFKNQSHKHKIYIGGNHDNFLEKCISDEVAKNLGVFHDDELQYLYDSGTKINNYKIWGSPWTRFFNGVNPKCASFMLNSDEELSEKWAKIPDDVDILITHSPPLGTLDTTSRRNRVGCRKLADRILELKNLKLHVFGHIHEGYGYCHAAYNTGSMDARKVIKENIEGTPLGHLSVNCAQMDMWYEQVRAPIRVKIENGMALVLEA